MYDESLRTQAQQILDQQLLPGRDQKEIRNSLSTLEHLLVQLEEESPRQAQKILVQTQDLYYQTECHRLSPKISQPIRNGLNEMTHILSDILTRLESQPIQPTYAIVSIKQLQQQKGLQTLGIKETAYKHIPYVRIETNAEIMSETHKIGLRTHLPKIYHAVPIYANKQQAWNLDIIRTRNAWKDNAGDGVNVGVIDTGIHTSHAEIHNAYKDGYNFFDDNKDVTDHRGHGTHVAGTIAGIDVGVAPNANLYALKIFGKTGFATEDGFLKAADWAIDNNMHLLNASFGSTQHSQVEQAMVHALKKHNITLVAAAGNAGNTKYSYPASYNGVVSVAAIDKNKQHAMFSQRNDQLTISAPGVSVYSCTPNGYDYMSGTSMAAPHVTGALSLLHAHNSQQNKISRLQESAEHLGDKILYGAGLIQADKLIQ
jgi:subtilisin family serine protease